MHSDVHASSLVHKIFCSLRFLLGKLRVPVSMAIWSSREQLILGYTCLYFVIILAVLAYGKPEALPVPTVTVWGQQWPVHVFTVEAILFAISSGLFVACLRQGHHFATAHEAKSIINLGVRTTVIEDQIALRSLSSWP